MTSHPIAPGCEIATNRTGTNEYCAIHQYRAEFWPCPEQADYEESDAYKLDMLSRKVDRLLKVCETQQRALEVMEAQHTRIAEQVKA